MSGFRDAILFDAIGRPPSNGVDRSRREGSRRVSISDEYVTLTRNEREKREISGLPKNVRERRWKGGY